MGKEGLQEGWGAEQNSRENSSNLRVITSSEGMHWALLDCGVP